MNRLLITLFAVLAASPFAWHHYKKTNIYKTQAAAAIKKSNDKKDATLARLTIFAKQLKQYADANDYDSHFCFLVDMKIESGSNRFFVYDIQKDSIVKSGLVAHGYGNSGYSDVTFSNVPGSNCTSQGKYKVGASYHGKFGLAYKLYGLDKTNSNAFNRFVVLHAHDCVPSIEISPLPLCRSQGCPTVAPSFLQTLKKYIDAADKPVLLWVFK